MVKPDALTDHNPEQWPLPRPVDVGRIALNSPEKPGSIQEYLERLSKTERSAYGAVKGYAETGVDTRTPEQMIEHSLRVRSLVKAYAGDKVPEMVLVASILHDIFDRNLNINSHKFTERRRSETREVLRHFSKESGLGRKERKYLYAIAKDMVKVEIASGRHRKSVAKLARTEPGPDEEGGQVGPDIARIISDKYEGEIPVEVWSTIEPYVDIKKMEKLLRNTNVEAVIIKACELLDNLKNPTSARESALLQDVLEAESFYAPIMGVLKLDGLASALKGEALKVRLEKTNNQRFIKEAQEALDDIESLADSKRSGTERVLGVALGSENMILAPAVGEDGFSKVMSTQPDKGARNFRPSQIGDIMLDYGYSQSRGHYRLKEKHALAKKIQDPERAAMDIVAATIESPGVEKLAERFAKLVSDSIKFDCQYNQALALENQRFTFVKSSANKNSGIYVAGSSKFIKSVKSALEQAGVSESCCHFDEDTKDMRGARGYKRLEVAKVTFKVHIEGREIPTEIQFVTQRERGRMRRGIISHVLYDYRKQNRQFDRGSSSKDKNKMNNRLVRLIKSMSGRVKNLNPDSLEVNHRTKPTEADRVVMDDILPHAA